MNWLGKTDESKTLFTTTASQKHTWNRRVETVINMETWFNVHCISTMSIWLDQAGFHKYRTMSYYTAPWYKKNLVFHIIQYCYADPLYGNSLTPFLEKHCFGKHDKVHAKVSLGMV